MKNTNRHCGSMPPLMLQIKREGQRYYHEPIVKELCPKSEFTTQLAWAISGLFNSRLPQMLLAVVGYTQIPLRWLNFDGSPKWGTK